MTDVLLHDGRELDIDLYQVTRREFVQLIKGSDDPEYEPRVLAKCCGLSYDELMDLPKPDYDLVIVAFLKKAREPLSDPS